MDSPSLLLSVLILVFAMVNKTGLLNAEFYEAGEIKKKKNDKATSLKFAKIAKFRDY